MQTSTVMIHVVKSSTRSISTQRAEAKGVNSFGKQLELTLALIVFPSFAFRSTVK